jgi:hypothetical protein
MQSGETLNISSYSSIIKGYIHSEQRLLLFKLGILQFFIFDSLQGFEGSEASKNLLFTQALH